MSKNNDRTQSQITKPRSQRKNNKIAIAEQLQLQNAIAPFTSFYQHGTRFLASIPR